MNPAELVPFAYCKPLPDCRGEEPTDAVQHGPEHSHQWDLAKAPFGDLLKRWAQVSSPGVSDARGVRRNVPGQPDHRKRELSKQTAPRTHRSHLRRHTENNCKVTAVFSPIHLSVLVLERTNTDVPCH